MLEKNNASAVRSRSGIELPQMGHIRTFGTGGSLGAGRENPTNSIKLLKTASSKQFDAYGAHDNRPTAGMRAPASNYDSS